MNEEGMSTMLYFLAGKPSAQMEIPFTFITEQVTHVWRSQPAASVLFFRGWIQIPVLETQTAFSGPCHLIVRNNLNEYRKPELAMSPSTATVDTSRVSSL